MLYSTTMLTTKEAIYTRRSVRKFKADSVPLAIIEELIDGARLAPSGGNSQPWCFKIVTDPVTKTELVSAAYNQKFLAEAPVVLVCCISLDGYIPNLKKKVRDLGRVQAVEPEIVNMVTSWADSLADLPVSQIAPYAYFDVAIAIEHIMLRALDFGLGTCWVSVDEEKVSEIFGWGQKFFPVALLPLGYPAQTPKPQKRRALSEIII